MKSVFQILVFVAAAVVLVGCAEKKKSDDIIATKVETPKPKGPIRMQDYTQNTSVKWLGRNYQVEVKRVPDDSLKMVQDEYGQKFVDNRISLRVLRADGTVFFNRSFTKAAFEGFLDSDYRETGILEGLVFDKAEGNNLFFAASVSHPQTDEYIPMIVTVSNLGDVGIRPDTDLDTNGSTQTESPDDNDEEGV
jgi:hypothetical protein